MSDKPERQTGPRKSGPVAVVSEERDDGTFEIRTEPTDEQPVQEPDESSAVPASDGGSAATAYIGLVVVLALLGAGAYLLFVSPRGVEREPPLVTVDDSTSTPTSVPGAGEATDDASAGQNARGADRFQHRLESPVIQRTLLHPPDQPIGLEPVRVDEARTGRSRLINARQRALNQRLQVPQAQQGRILEATPPNRLAPRRVADDPDEVETRILSPGARHPESEESVSDDAVPFDDEVAIEVDEELPHQGDEDDAIGVDENLDEDSGFEEDEEYLDDDEYLDGDDEYLNNEAYLDDELGEDGDYLDDDYLDDDEEYLDDDEAYLDDDEEYLDDDEYLDDELGNDYE